MELYFEKNGHADHEKFNRACRKKENNRPQSGKSIDEKLNKAREIANKRREEMRESWKRVLRVHYGKNFNE